MSQNEERGEKKETLHKMWKCWLFLQDYIFLEIKVTVSAFIIREWQNEISMPFSDFIQVQRKY